ncbi:tumor necrosis factor receptor superfamily member 16 [Lingula anatina]|uniref:Tumor necrosis factor receptor superfamily member 16 n=1 Tax=Lingula anatina TaxID=7574 RepID=A0A1S3H569_LINAN|nr:tumor necrosis factor receptor superfamily member 16 [Lingula anatina]|eukprot:XP_013381112.1 tumor necrosis factor receptor superfamily member 16 [Lingula anatina]
MGQWWDCVLVLVLLLKVHAELSCTSNEIEYEGVRCCSKCPPGRGVAALCSPDNDTVCRPCDVGVTFSSLHSHTEACRPCSTCGVNAHVLKKCNGTHDTQCECDSGFHYNLSEKRCEECNRCHPGWGASLACNHHYNTVCRPCPNGTYSEYVSAHLGCIVCTKCSDDHIKLQDCTPYQDTLCMAKSLLGSSKVASKTAPVSPPVNYNPGYDIIPLYCAVLGLLVIGLLAYVVVKQWQRNAAHRANKLNTTGVTPSSIRVDPTCQIQVPPSSHGSDSGVFLDSDGKPVTSTMKVRDLPPNKKKEIEVRLHHKRGGRGDWTGLARELGYTKSRITSLESHACRENHVPARYLLLEWSKNDSATVGMLVRALKSIGRHDVVKVLNGRSRKLFRAQPAEIV